MDEEQNVKPPEENTPYATRGFRPPEGLTGKSVVYDRSGADRREKWPYSLGDYLKGYVGNKVRVGCVLPNGRYFEKAGELATVGTNFIGLRPKKNTDGLVLLDLATVKGIEVARK